VPKFVFRYIMEKCIEILDYLENNEKEWFTCTSQIKQNVQKGLEELANYSLTTDSSVPIFLPSSASTTLSSNFTISPHPPPQSNPHLLRAQTSFLASLQAATHLAQLKLPLKQKLQH